MSTIVTRAGKGSPLTNTEMDSNLTNLNTDKIETAMIVAATSKTTPADADLFPLVDSAASNTLKKLTWANLKAAITGSFATLTGVETLTNKTLTSPVINGTGLNFTDSSVQTTAATGFGFKNRIINGDMRIDQRNAGATITPTSDGTFSVDRWLARLSQPSKYSIGQNAGAVTPPAGFNTYLGVTSLSAYTVGASEYFSVQQAIEGYNVADLGWGTANAQAITVSFWVRSSLTGTFGGTMYNSAANRCYPFSYTISSANTWEYKTIVVPGDTTGTWVKDNGIGLTIVFGLGAGATVSGTAGSWGSTLYRSATGATSVVGTSGATFYITGVQLEKGSTATSFDYRPYGTELALCQRYYNTGRVIGKCSLYNVAQSAYDSFQCSAFFKVSMRATPTVTYTNNGNSWTYSVIATTTEMVDFQKVGNASDLLDLTYYAPAEL